MRDGIAITIGVKSDPIEYRYSYEWLFRIMAEEGVRHLQLGSFFELYGLPDAYFVKLRASAEAHGIAISSVFTSHRELGGFLRGDPHFEEVAQRNYKRLIEVGALLGARQVGSNAGAVLRDEMDRKAEDAACHLRHMKELMGYAYEKGLECLTIEPMSCLAEPPTLPHEIRAMAEELNAHHAATPNTVPVGYCTDTSHGYADRNSVVRHSNLEVLEATFPWLAELHLKNTDERFCSTFGFSEAERAAGIVDLPAIRDLIQAKAAQIPRNEVIAYLELGGPKRGRDYSDPELEGMLRTSLRYITRVFT